jgi:hypothetical protein
VIQGDNIMRLSQVFIVVTFSATILFSQEESEESSDSLYFRFVPDSIKLAVGDSATVSIQLLKNDGDLANNAFYTYGGQRGTLSVYPRISDSTGVANVLVKAYKPGDLSLNVRSVSSKRLDRVRDEMPVTVPYPPLARIEFDQSTTQLYEGTSVQFKAKVFDEAGLTRNETDLTFFTTNSSIAEFDDFGNLNAKSTGRVRVTAQVDNVTSSINVRVVKNPVRGMELSSSAEEVRTGDVVHFTAKALARSSREVEDAPIYYSYTGIADYGIGLPAAGQMSQDGRFVAETSGLYTIYASSGGYSAQKTIKVVPREVTREIELVGYGLVPDVFTSDLWIWPGIGKHEGKDFAITGTWGADGNTYFWDVTDPKNMTTIDTVNVDARTVNDVKISEDGTVGVITREGASNRKNGFVILDVSDPYNVQILSTFNDDMTGGVHNTFVYDNHVYAVNNGRKYDIINIEDPSNPHRVGVYELKTPGHSIHDVWIVDGIAYSSNWADGVHAVDVGGIAYNERNMPMIQANPLLARAGKGSPSNPTPISYKKDPTGRNHAAFPFLSESTGELYIIAGDESFPFGLGATKNEPSNPRGGFHFVNFTDPDNPEEVAIYQVPEAGSHNLWVKGDTLMAAFYQGGFRILDISGELMGDLYKQGREIAFFLSSHKDGYLPNAPMVWGTQPYKGLIYFADMNSGLYAIRLVSTDAKKETD